jgi:hypothetical protein
MDRQHQSALAELSADRSLADPGRHLVLGRVAVGVAIYVVWLWNNIGEFSLTLLGAIFLGLAALDFLVCVLVRIPLRLFPYIPLYTLMQNLVMRPVRLIAILSELIFVHSRRDNYIPEQQRWRLS